MNSSGTVDLHAHTSVSDGALTPEELVEEAAYAGLAAVAVTDHDAVEGVPRALTAGTRWGVEVVPGVELSCLWEGREAHLVGLFLEPDAALEAHLEHMRRMRVERMREMLDRLATRGIAIGMDDLPDEAGQRYGRPHLARAMVAKGIVRSIPEAFARYLGDRGAIHVPKDRLPLEEGLALLRGAHAVTVLAHPEKSGLAEAVPDLARRGLDAVEVYHPMQTPAGRARLKSIALENGLAIGGGSDFHGPEGAALGTPPLPAGLLERLRERKETLWPVS